MVFHGGLSGTRPGAVADARKKDMKNKTTVMFVITDNEIMTVKRSGWRCNKEPLRFDVNAKLNSIHTMRLKIPRPTTNAFIFHPQ
jgi:hypothetical protein